MRADIVTSKPGKTGGFALKILPETLSLQAVIDAIDAPQNGEAYPLDMQSYGNVLRPLYLRLSQMDAFLRKECGKILIKDLLS